jgi:hypothetical protein
MKRVAGFLLTAERIPPKPSESRADGRITGHALVTASPVTRWLPHHQSRAGYRITEAARIVGTLNGSIQTRPYQLNLTTSA